MLNNLFVDSFILGLVSGVLLGFGIFLFLGFSFLWFFIFFIIFSLIILLFVLSVLVMLVKGYFV